MFVPSDLTVSLLMSGSCRSSSACMSRPRFFKRLRPDDMRSKFLLISASRSDPVMVLNSAFLSSTGFVIAPCELDLGIGLISLPFLRPSALFEPSLLRENLAYTNALVESNSSKHRKRKRNAVNTLNPPKNPLS